MAWQAGTSAEPQRQNHLLSASPHARVGAAMRGGAPPGRQGLLLRGLGDGHAGAESVERVLTGIMVRESQATQGSSATGSMP